MENGMMREVIREDLCTVYNSDVPWETFNDSTIMVTGAYGMIASYLVYMLIWLNEEKKTNICIVPIIRSMEKFRKRFGEYADRDYMHPQISPLDRPIEFNEKVDYIIHAASLASPQHYSVRPVDVLTPNTIGTYNLLEFSRIKGLKGFLFFSSGAIYGTVRKEHDICESDMGESDPLNVQSSYAESKRMGETMCKAYELQYGVPVKIARIWHTYAPTMDIDNDPRVFASFVKNIVNGEDIIMKSDGSAKRAFCYITDAITGLFLILAKGKNGEAYNVCNTSQFCSVKELAVVLSSIKEDRKVNVITQERNPIETYTENPAKYEFPPSDSKLRELGWTPQISIREGFSKVLKAIS